MARGELLRKLFRSFRRGSDDEFRAAALEVIAEEQRKHNHRLAKDLMRILENNGQHSLVVQPASPLTNPPPQDRERRTMLVDIRQPDRRYDEILLNAENRRTVDGVLSQYRKAEVLRVHSLKPSTKLLFCGPPGCGKTLCSEIIATELGLPLMYCRFDAIVSSYLGETAANLRKVFDYAAQGRWVILFDEFDAIGKARDDPDEHGELKRVVNSFLQLLDGFTAPSIVVAATNHEQLLDPALWRRFDELVVFPRPSLGDIKALLKIKLKNFPHDDLDFERAASKLRGMSHADVERVCLDSVKSAILADLDAVTPEVFTQALKRQQARLRITRQASQSRNRRIRR